MEGIGKGGVVIFANNVLLHVKYAVMSEAEVLAYYLNSCGTEKEHGLLNHPVTV